MSHWDAREFFRADEFDVPDRMDAGLISKLELARASAGTPFFITSDFREPVEKPSAHHLGKAVDIRASESPERYLIVRGLILAGFVRIGVYDKHVHADTATPADGFPLQVMWTGISR